MAAGTRKNPPRTPTKTGATGGGRRPAPRRVNRRKRTATSLPWRAGLITILLLLSLGTLAYLVFLHQPTPSTDSDGQKLSVVPPAPTLPAAPDLADEQSPPPSPPKPREAVAPPPAAPAPDLPRPVALPGGDQRPLVAIIIDDMGYRPETERLMLALDLELTFSFLPFSPHLSQSLTAARQQNRDILLHLPLEALDSKWSSTPGMLLTTMGAGEIADGFAAALAQVPMAIGLNNHMGSRFTTDPAAMDRLLTQTARYDLFFLDSLTTPDSVAAAAASRHQVPFLRRDIFLDNDQEEQKIRAQLEALLKIAEKRGYAIGIGHSYPETLRALENFRPELEGRARPVGLSRLYQLQ